MKGVKKMKRMQARSEAKENEKTKELVKEIVSIYNGFLRPEDVAGLIKIYYERTMKNEHRK